jgi:hypothetical protein
VVVTATEQKTHRLGDEFQEVIFRNIITNKIRVSFSSANKQTNKKPTTVIYFNLPLICD